MEEVQLQLNEEGNGSLFIEDEEKVLGRLEIEVDGVNLRAVHTEVIPEAEGKGLAKKMFLKLVEYARDKQLTIIPVCEYVGAQLKKNPEAYQDVWKN